MCKHIFLKLFLTNFLKKKYFFIKKVKRFPCEVNVNRYGVDPRQHVQYSPGAIPRQATGHQLRALLFNIIFTLKKLLLIPEDIHLTR